MSWLPGPFVLRTPRFVLRELTPKDAPFLYALNSDPEVIRYTGDPPFASLEATETFLRTYDHYRRFGMGRWVVEDAAGEALGWCGLKTQEHGRVDLGYRFFRRHWGKGVATETARASLEYGFTTRGLEEIVATAAVENVASVRVLEKLGMTRVGTATCGSDPALTFRLSRDEWRRRR